MRDVELLHRLLADAAPEFSWYVVFALPWDESFYAHVGEYQVQAFCNATMSSGQVRTYYWMDRLPRLPDNMAEYAVNAVKKARAAFARRDYVPREQP